MRKRHLLLLAIAALAGSLLGCAPLARVQLRLARKLETRGRLQSAYVLYEGALKRLPAQRVAERSETYYHMGECLWTLGRPSEAFEAFQHAVDADGTNLLARLRLGEVLLAGGAVDRASEQAVAVLQAGHGSIEAMALLGAASSAAGQDQVAEKAFQKVLEQEPYRTSIAVALADMYNREDRVDDARRALLAAASAQPGNALPWLALGRLEEQEGNAAAAEQAYREAVHREDTPESNLRLAQFLERSARVDETEKVLRKVDQMRPRQPTALPDFELLAGRVPNALDRYELALRSSALERPPLAHEPAPELAAARAAVVARLIEADLEMARASDGPVSALALPRLHLDQFRAELDPGTLAILQAEIALVEGNVSEAQARAEAAVKLAPNSAPSQYVLGTSRYRAGEVAQARSAWLESVQKDSSFVPARLALAREALRTHDANGAEQYVVPAVREEPANTRALGLYARVLIAEDRLGAAAVIANRAAAIGEKSAEPSVLLGEIALRLGHAAEALARFERAVLLEPDSQEAIEGLVRVYRKGSIRRPMLRKLEELAAGNPQSSALMEITGRLYAAQGRYTDAERCLRAALRMDPRRNTAATAMARLFALRGNIDAASESARRVGGETAALLSALTAQERNDAQQAIVQYEAALRAGEHSGVAANNLAWLYAQQGTLLDRALTLAEMARAQAPQDPAVLDTVGVVHLRRREYSAAIDVLRDAAELAAARRPALSAEIEQHLSEASLRAGIPESAKRPRHNP